MKIRLFLLPTIAIALVSLLTLLIPVSVVKADTIQEAPEITSAYDTIFDAGTSGTFTVTATGSPTPALSQTGALPGGVTFVDNHNGTATLSGATAAGSVGTYPLTIKAANGVLPDATQSFTLTVNQSPSITAQPANQTVAVGQTASFSAAASGYPAPTVQWQVSTNGGMIFVNLPGATSTTYTTPPITNSMNGYQIRAVFSNIVGSAYSNAATLTVGAAQVAPTIISFTPTSGGAGTVVTITGTNFSGATAVVFGGTAASFTVVSVSQITATVGSGARGKVSVTTPGGTATSTGDFTFTGGVNPIVVTSPNGSERWEVFSLQTITWNTTRVSGPVKIELSRDGGVTWATIIPMAPNDGTQKWIVLRGATTQAKIKVSSISNPALFDISDANFTIVEPSITVTSPNSGERWKIGSTQTITWDSTSVLLVKIELSRDSGATWTTIAASIANHGDKTWTVTGPATSHARIRVVSLSNSASDISDVDFTIMSR